MQAICHMLADSDCRFRFSFRASGTCAGLWEVQIPIPISVAIAGMCKRPTRERTKSERKKEDHADEETKGRGGTGGCLLLACESLLS